MLGPTLGSTLGTALAVDVGFFPDYALGSLVDEPVRIELHNKDGVSLGTLFNTGVTVGLSFLVGASV